MAWLTAFTAANEHSRNLHSIKSAMETEPSVEQQTGAAVDDTKKGGGRYSDPATTDQHSLTSSQTVNLLLNREGRRKNGENEVEQQAENAGCMY